MFVNLLLGIIHGGDDGALDEVRLLLSLVGLPKTIIREMSIGNKESKSQR